MREIYEAHGAGDADRAREIQERLAPVYEAMTVTSNPTPVKTALELMGVASARVRLPMVEADDEQRAAVRAALEAHGTLATA